MRIRGWQERTCQRFILVTNFMSSLQQDSSYMSTLDVRLASLNREFTFFKH